MRNLLYLLPLSLVPATLAALDLTNAVIVAPPSLSKREQKAAQVLIEEVQKRSWVAWKRGTSGAITIRLGKRGGPAEGYQVVVKPDGVDVLGNDERGVLFGAGYLLRQLRISRESVTVPDGINVTTAPKYPLRGHQLGYRPKTNSYDAWDVPQWDQYIRELALFGANAIELIPPRSDDDDDSPHLPRSKQRMMIEMSRIADEYGLDVWVWYAAMDRDYSDAATVDFALKEWADVVKQLPRVDHMFVPGGDPGHTQPKYLMALLEKQTASLRRFHPKVKMWVSPQGFSEDWLTEFIDIVKKEPAWLEGLVHGPQVRWSLAELRAKTPRRYPVRNYPDITHTLRAQFPVPDWDVAHALTSNREPVNPRPMQEAVIFKAVQPGTNGFLTYSEGCNDDVNKFVWSGLGWNPDASVGDILREYSRLFIGAQLAEAFTQGLLGLERNWIGPLATNEGVYTTVKLFDDMDHAATPAVLRNWRFQQAQYRAHYDAYTRARLLHERTVEDRAMEQLGGAGALAAMAAAESTLTAKTTMAEFWRTRTYELAEALFQSIGMQLSVPYHRAIGVDRGATLDTFETPLNNRIWLLNQFAEIRKLGDEKARAAAIRTILNWTNPGPGGYYDDMGDPSNSQHLLRGLGFDKDPGYQTSPLTGFGVRGTRVNWFRFGEGRYAAPLEWKYTNLDPDSRYKIRLVYTGDAGRKALRLSTAQGVEIHPFFERPYPFKPVEFDIPANAVVNGELHLKLEREAGAGGNGRGPQVSDVWLVRK